MRRRPGRRALPRRSPLPPIADGLCGRCEAFAPEDERNGVGLNRASFYMAYALYYEKHMRFSDAKKMYHLGIQNLAEPIGELHKPHEQFTVPIESYKRRTEKVQERTPGRVGSGATTMNQIKGDSLWNGYWCPFLFQELHLSIL